MINVLCDRALLAAYAHGIRRVTTATVRLAARDVQGNAGRRDAVLRFAWRAGWRSSAAPRSRRIADGLRPGRFGPGASSSCRPGL